MKFKTADSTDKLLLFSKFGFADSTY